MEPGSSSSDDFPSLIPTSGGSSSVDSDMEESSSESGESLLSLGSASESEEEGSDLTEEPTEHNELLRPLYDGAKLTVFDAFVLLLQFSLRYGPTYTNLIRQVLFYYRFTD